MTSRLPAFISCVFLIGYPTLLINVFIAIRFSAQSYSVSFDENINCATESGMPKTVNISWNQQKLKKKLIVIGSMSFARILIVSYSFSSVNLISRSQIVIINWITKWGRKKILKPLWSNESNWWKVCLFIRLFIWFEILIDRAIQCVVAQNVCIVTP